jgi:hypothetical protein
MAAAQVALTRDRFRFMQAVIFATSGTNSLQSLMTSGVQACCTSGLTSASAGAEPKARTEPSPRSTAPAANHDDVSFLSSTFFMDQSVLCACEHCPQPRGGIAARILRPVFSRNIGGAEFPAKAMGNGRSEQD